MNLITHDWNGSVIAQLSEATKIAKHDVPSGYVNLTQMCKACEKKFNHYASLNSTKAYWEGLSLDTGIPASFISYHHKRTWRQNTARNLGTSRNRH